MQISESNSVTLEENLSFATKKCSALTPGTHSSSGNSVVFSGLHKTSAERVFQKRPKSKPAGFSFTVIRPVAEQLEPPVAAADAQFIGRDWV